MYYLIKNQKIINIVFIISVILDIGISFIVNIISQEIFNIFAKHNVVACVILIVLITTYIVCQLLIRSNTAKGQKRHLQKAFKDNGGYDSVVKEMITCIETHDFKSIKELKKAVKYIER